nr:ferredoxin-2, mitochondrial isoform X4 [Kogia breviceps]
MMPVMAASVAWGGVNAGFLRRAARGAWWCRPGGFWGSGEAAAPAVTKKFRATGSRPAGEEEAGGPERPGDVVNVVFVDRSGQRIPPHWLSCSSSNSPVHGCLKAFAFAIPSEVLSHPIFWLLLILQVPIIRSETLFALFTLICCLSWYLDVTGIKSVFVKGNTVIADITLSLLTHIN